LAVNPAAGMADKMKNENRSENSVSVREKQVYPDAGKRRDVRRWIWQQ